MYRKVAARYFADRYARLLLAMSEPEALTILGFPRSAKPSLDEIKRAYRTRAFETHPDRGGSTEDFIEINVAKDFLMRVKSPYTPPSGGSPYRPSRPQSVEPDHTETGQTFQKGWSANNPPSNTEWKFVSIPEYYWETSNHPGHRIWTMYGFTGTKHIFCAVKERGESAGFVMTGKGMTKIMEDWQVSWHDANLKTPLTRIATKYLKTVATGWADLAKSPKPPRKFVLWPGGRPSEQLFKKVPRSGGVALKDILVGAGLLSDMDPSVKGRKSAVQMRFEFSLDKQMRRQQVKKFIRRVDQYDIYVSVNGKEAKLTDDTVDNLAKTFIPWIVGWDAVSDGVRRDLTKLRKGRFKGGAPEAMRHLADALTSEPSWLIIALEKAAEEYEDTSKTACLHQLCSEMTLHQASSVLDKTLFDLVQELVA